jgi:NADH:ubiquinone oxidoreductase subunit 5 (subunit L)/multisubunit Na+/H+ antiporter MnhA subunit
MTGALAVACFVKVYGAVFLGEPRSGACREAHEAPASMVAPMAILAAGCMFIGLAPVAVLPLLERALSAWAPAADLRILPLVPVGWISVAGGSLLGGAALVFFWLRRRAASVPRVGTWDCGYAAPSPRMQYTASSFGQFLVTQFAWLLRPRIHKPPVTGAFPVAARFESHVEDMVLRWGVTPAWRWTLLALGRLRFLQQGRIQVYVLYVAAFAVVLLAVSMGMHP